MQGSGGKERGEIAHGEPGREDVLMMGACHVLLKERIEAVEKLPEEFIKRPKEERLDEEEELAMSKTEPSLTFMVDEIKVGVSETSTL